METENLRDDTLCVYNGLVGRRSEILDEIKKAIRETCSPDAATERIARLESEIIPLIRYIVYATQPVSGIDDLERRAEQLFEYVDTESDFVQALEPAPARAVPARAQARAARARAAARVRAPARAAPAKLGGKDSLCIQTTRIYEQLINSQDDVVERMYFMQILFSSIELELRSNSLSDNNKIKKILDLKNAKNGPSPLAGDKCKWKLRASFRLILFKI